MMRTTAEKKGDKFILNGQKRFIVGGVGAYFYVTFAITDPSATPCTKGVSAFIIDRDTPGLYVTTVYGLIGTRRGGTARIIFKNAEIPAENLIGELNGGYDVFSRMMIPECLTTAAGSLGVANAAIETSSKICYEEEGFW